MNRIMHCCESKWIVLGTFGVFEFIFESEISTFFGFQKPDDSTQIAIQNDSNLTQ